MALQSGNDPGQVLFAHAAACLKDRSDDILRGHKALVKLHVKEPGLLVELRPGDARDSLDFGAHGVGAARSEDAPLFFHAVHLKGELGQEVFFHVNHHSMPRRALTPASK